MSRKGEIHTERGNIGEKGRYKQKGENTLSIMLLKGYSLFAYIHQYLG